MRTLIMLALILFTSISIFGYTKNDVSLGIAGGWSYNTDSREDENGEKIGKITQHHQAIWGFYVDIPIISTLNITPSTLLYRVEYENQHLSAADVSLNIKFKVPLRKFTLYALGTGGITQMQLKPKKSISAHAGGGAGLSLHLVSNLSAFAEFNYRVVLSDDGNIKNMFALTGVLWHF